MNTDQIELQRPRIRHGWINPYSKTICILRALPFFRSRHGAYIHRPRSGVHYFWAGKYSHTVFELWCGQSGHLSKGELLNNPQAGQTICATCEGRARGAGQLGSRMICGRIVKFSPKNLSRYPIDGEAAEQKSMEACA